MKLRHLLLIASALTLIAALACSSSDESDQSPTPGGPTGDITVFAASSLTLAFQELGAAFEEEYPGTNVTFNFAGTPTLRTQLEQGAGADVFASANAPQMQMALDAGVIDGTPLPFASNRLVVITPEGGDVTSLADLAAEGALVVLALPEVPVGAYSRESLTKLSGSDGLPADYADRVLANVVSEETNVRQVMAKIALGEADAGIVYQTDVDSESADDIATIQIPDASNVIAIYPIAQVEGAGNPGGGAAFIEFARSAEGQAVLAESGFGPAS